MYSATKTCGCGATFTASYEIASTLLTRTLCDDCRKKHIRYRETAANIPANTPRCKNCDALVGAQYGSVTHLDKDGRCPSCAYFERRKSEKEQRERAGLTMRGGLWVAPAWKVE